VVIALSVVIIANVEKREVVVVVLGVMCVVVCIVNKFAVASAIGAPVVAVAVEIGVCPDYGPFSIRGSRTLVAGVAVVLHCLGFFFSSCCFLLGLIEG
jgi:hypothetical protein